MDLFDTNGLFVRGENPNSGCKADDSACLLVGAAFNFSLVPGGTSMRTLLLARPGLTRTTRAVGALLRQVHNSSRLRGASVDTLSYWSDNAAGYSWWSQPGNDLDSFGPIGELYLRLQQEYSRQGIWFGAWQSDNTFGRTPAIDSSGKTAGGWCFNDWTRWNLTQYPGGGSLKDPKGWPARMRAQQNSTMQAPMAFSYYLYYHCHDNVWRNGVPAFGSRQPGGGNRSRWAQDLLDVGMWRSSKPLNYGRGDQSVALVHPDAAYNFYRELFAHARDEWGLAMLFKDDLQDQGSRLAPLFPEVFGVKNRWLGGLTAALASLGLEMQACMTAPQEIMSSLDWPAVTNARVSGDGGASLADASVGSVLTAILGVGWSKDNVRIPANSSKWGFDELQIMAATLSLGPVGLADRLSDLPNKTEARITSNVTLAKMAAALNGSLLQPSFPLTSTSEVLEDARGLGVRAGHVWTTHTAVASESTAAQAGLWFTAVAFGDQLASGHFDAGTSPDQDPSSSRPWPTADTCSYTANADKTSGSCMQKLANQTQQECCKACWALAPPPSRTGLSSDLRRGAFCNAYVRDPATGDCFLIQGCKTVGKTRPATSRDIGFTRETPPAPGLTFTVVPGAHLMPLVDLSAGQGDPARPVPFREPPRGAFLGAGSGLGSLAGLVAWERAVRASAIVGTRCGTLLPTASSAVNVTVTNERPSQTNFAPLFPGARVALLGEADKFTAVSTFRFRRVSVEAKSGGLRIELAGSVGETVTLLFLRVEAGAGDADTLSACESVAVSLNSTLQTFVLEPARAA